ncbi:NAD(P)-dependent oxidoreductase [Kitasatospora sp. NA04385]|uniref:SDR family oxidoreductase n=1 Tax=Kitasatospora sp. NA04385 TaxID=2742135 RepID=UPI00159143F9|nr:NAD(P)-dependent oxidoreductase [Kitasatospora sp. NA04385]QKW20269.1 NAD(P)-dependent oxidoreductase [Kitasatospora sp. NA04385]
MGGARPERIYVTGADGMLGQALVRALRADGRTAHWPVHGVSLADFDIADGRALSRSVDGFRPTVVVHLAACAIVDTCEADPRLAMRVNVRGTRNVAEQARRHGARMVYLSSDYVFDGLDTPEHGYTEQDLPNPVSVYGLTKLAGERITSLLPDSLVVRTSWLFGGADERVDNVLAAVRAAERGEPALLVSDQYSLPTGTRELAEALVHLLCLPEPPGGTVHIGNAGRASWYDVGLELRRQLRAGAGSAAAPAPVPVPMADCGFRGDRPVDSTLNTDRLRSLGHTMTTWRDALRAYLRTLGARPSPAGAPGDASAPHGLAPAHGRGPA